MAAEDIEKQSEQSESVDKNAETVVYELGYHLVPSVGEENVPSEVTKIKGTIESHGGSFVMEEFPKQQELAYEMDKMHGGKREKFLGAYFGWIKFNMTPENILLVKKELDESENMLRYLIFKTVREDTRAPKRVMAPKEVSMKDKIISAPRKEEKKGNVSDEELDKTIEELVK